DLEQGQGQVLAAGEVVERALDGGGVAQGTRAQEEHRRAADLRVLRLLLRRPLRELAARRELDDEALEELQRVVSAQRMEPAAVQVLAAARQQLRLDVRHGAEER